MDHTTRLRQLEDLVATTFSLWDQTWVGFSWRAYYLNHTRRVRNLCLAMAALENGDPLLLEYAAILHDVTKRYDGDAVRDASGKRAVDANGFWRNEPLPPAVGRRNAVIDLYEALNLHGALHNVSGAAVGQALLTAHGLDAEFAQRVSTIICDHVRGAPPPGTPEPAYPLESQILYDADTLDANMGLVAFYRNVQILSRRTILQKGTVNLRDYVAYLPSWLEMKEPFIAKMTTCTGRALAAERQSRNRAVYTWLQEELADFERNQAEGLLGVVEYFISTNADPDLERDRRHLTEVWVAQRPANAHVRDFCVWLGREVAGES